MLFTLEYDFVVLYIRLKKNPKQGRLSLRCGKVVVQREHGNCGIKSYFSFLFNSLIDVCRFAFYTPDCYRPLIYRDRSEIAQMHYTLFGDNGMGGIRYT